MKKLYFIIVGVIILIIPTVVSACDTSPVITVNSPSDNGDGTYNLDIQVCIGDGGSLDGFSTSIDGGVNILGFTPAIITNPLNSNTATGNITAGVLEYFDASGTAISPFVVGFTNTCFDYTLTVDADPSAATITFMGVNAESSEIPGSCAVLGGNTQSEFVPSPPVPLVCGSIFTDSGGSAGNYTNSENETYTICPDNPAEPVTLNFNVFDIENGFDNLNIYDDNGTTSPVAGSPFTGTNSPGTIMATNPTGCLTVVFTSDGSVTDIGWEADIICGSIFSCDDGPFTDGVGNYVNDANDTYYFCPQDPSFPISLDFTEFDLEDGFDFLTIYDNNIVSGASTSYTGAVSPGIIAATNSTGCLTIVFTSNSSIVEAGWSAEVSCDTPSILCGDTISFSDGIGNYANSASESFLFCSGETNTPVTIDFSVFDIENGFDNLNIYDSNDQTSPIAGSPFTGTNSPGIITSTNSSGCFSLLFTSDGSVTDIGWEANVYLPLCCIDTVINLAPIISCDSAEVNGVWYFTSQTVSDIFPTVSGCDSIENTEITINNSTSNTVNDTICFGSTYTLPEGDVVSTAGTYLDTIPTMSGNCDSIITTNLTVITFGGAPNFVLNGNALLQGSDTVQLTPAQNTQTGAAWNDQSISLNQSFDYSYNVFFGCNNAGADGMAFVLQNGGTGVIGSNGEALASGGIVPSLVIQFDTYTNSISSNDPVTDHVAILQNGAFDHNSANSLANPVNMEAGGANMTDCMEHTLRIVWNAITQTFDIYIDGDLRLSYTGDVVTNVFGGNPNVFWGFTASTGGLNNRHYFRYIENEPFDSLVDTTICAGDAIQIEAPLTGNSYTWSPNTNIVTNTDFEPTFSPTTTTDYDVLIDYNGCEVRDTFTITVNQNPTPNITGNLSYCPENNSTTLDAGSGFNTYDWSTTGNGQTESVSIADNPISVTVTDANGCSGIDQVTVAEYTSPTVVANVDINPVCEDENISLTGSGATPPYTWDNGVLDGQAFAPTDGQVYTVTADDANGCSGTDNITIQVTPTPTKTLTPFICENGDYVLGNGTIVLGAGTYFYTDTVLNDCDTAYTVIVGEYPNPTPTAVASPDTIYINNSTTLTGQGGETYDWGAAGGGESIDVFPPVSGVNVYDLTVTDVNGCEGSTSVQVIVLEEELEIIMPNAFSPNGDGLNDVFKLPHPEAFTNIGLRVYNRWGELMHDGLGDGAIHGWAGMYNGEIQPIDSYKYYLTATSRNTGEVYEIVGTIQLLK